MCDTKCITLTACDGPWCLQAPSCPTDIVPLTGTQRFAGAQLRMVRRDTLIISDGGTDINGTYTVTHTGRGFLVAQDAANLFALRLEGHNGHLVCVKVFYDYYNTPPQASKIARDDSYQQIRDKLVVCRCSDTSALSTCSTCSF